VNTTDDTILLTLKEALGYSDAGVAGGYLDIYFYRLDNKGFTQPCVRMFIYGGSLYVQTWLSKKFSLSDPGLVAAVKCEIDDFSNGLLTNNDF